MSSGIQAGQGQRRRWRKTLTTDEQIDVIPCKVLDERHITIHSIAKSIGINSGLVYTVLNQTLGMSKLFVRWVTKDAEKHWHLQNTSKLLPGKS